MASAILGFAAFFDKSLNSGLAVCHDVQACRWPCSPLLWAEARCWEEACWSQVLRIFHFHHGGAGDNFAFGERCC